MDETSRSDVTRAALGEIGLILQLLVEAGTVHAKALARLVLERVPELLSNPEAPNVLDDEEIEAMAGLYRAFEADEEKEH